MLFTPVGELPDDDDQGPDLASGFGLNQNSDERMVPSRENPNPTNTELYSPPAPGRKTSADVAICVHCHRELQDIEPRHVFNRQTGHVLCMPCFYRQKPPGKVFKMGNNGLVDITPNRTKEVDLNAKWKLRHPLNI